MALAAVSLNVAPIKFDQTLADAFPDVDPGVRPFGSRVLVQVRSVKQRSAGGIELVKETQETVAYNTQVGKVIAMGPYAFCNRDTMMEWPEGAWCKVGDFVRIPKYGNDDRWERAVLGGDDIVMGTAMFAMFNDLQLLGLVTCDPRDIVAFI